MTVQDSTVNRRHWVYSAIILALVVVVVVLGLVLVLRNDDDGDSSALNDSYCCTVDRMECTFSEYCDSNVTACLACSGLFVAEQSLGATSNLRSPTSANNNNNNNKTGTDGLASSLAPSMAPTISMAPTFGEPGQVCATPGQDGRANTILLEGSEGETVLLERSSVLCTLWQVQQTTTNSLTRNGNNKNKVMIPVGRSYEGHAWEPYSGEFADLKFACDPTTCSFTLPKLLGDDYVYQLASFDYESPREDQVARFLEQATFGPTRETIQSFPDSFADWIKEQQEVTPMSSHRKFYRERATFRNVVPSARGISSDPCKAGARYRRYALTSDDRRSPFELTTDKTGRKVLSIDGSTRTVLNTAFWLNLPDGHYGYCDSISNKIGTRTRIPATPQTGCNPKIDMFNPAVFFDDQTPPNVPTLNLNVGVLKLSEEELHLTEDLDDPICSVIPPQRMRNRELFAGKHEGEYWLFDSQLTLQDNTLESPLPDGGGSLVKQTKATKEELKENSRADRSEVVCANAPMSFLNEDHCQLSYVPDACSPRGLSDTPITLDIDTFQKVFEATGNGEADTRYLYAVEGLRQPLSDSVAPCSPGTTSRWIPFNCSATERQVVTVGSGTTAVFASLLSQSQDENPSLRDVSFPLLGSSCDEEDKDKFDFMVQVENKCWLNVHRSHLQVYDFTDWIEQHPGGKEAIENFSNGFVLQFPDWHGMDRWEGFSKDYRIEIGRYGDIIPFSSFPTHLTTERIASSLGALPGFLAAGPTVVCGTPNEVKNKLPYAGEEFSTAMSVISSNERAEDQSKEQKKWTWLAIALNGQDQLRQRVAWTLSQILVVSTGEFMYTEAWVAYYDIFVRHAFGSYRDVLKEVSFSPLMSIMLSYRGNKGTEYFWREQKRVGYADENYAREIMQLFTVGLFKLNNDGTPKKDENGKTILSYTNNEIMEYARVWTGFEIPLERGNIESNWWGNYVDVLRMQPSWRDSLPKLGLDAFYIGDGLPLCADLPDKHFLKKGAAYILLGSVPKPKYHYEPDNWYQDQDTTRTALDVSSSELHARLCNKDPNTGRCRFSSKVVLDEDVECYGVECMIQAPRIVQVEPNVYYEYVRMPCAFQAYFAEGKVVSGSEGQLACGDGRAEVGSITCCQEGGGAYSPAPLQFSGERATFTEAERRCAEAGATTCREIINIECSGVCDGSLEYWIDSPCSQQVKIDVDGKIGLVHSTPLSSVNDIISSAREDTKTMFGVVWSLPNGIDGTDFFSDYDGMCSSLGCERDSFDNMCLCSAETRETRAFGSPPKRLEVLRDLHIGAFSPHLYWGPHPVFDLGDGVRMHSMDGFYSTETVFEVVDDNGLTQFRKNLLSDVVISNGGLEVSFRNPTHMISIHDPELRDVLYETDAALDHFFFHPNTAPFLAVRFAQRFGLSNPSPRYIDTAAKAFRAGIYRQGGSQFGSGEYGNLGAMVAALLLDREARSVVLDADPAHGSLLEPFLRLIRVLKALEFHQPRGYVDFQNNLDDQIGQDVYELPNVFSFFLPEFQPIGPIGDGGLKCPECQIMSGPKIVSLLNGLFSLMKYGLTSEYGGFGSDKRAKGFNQYKPTREDGSSTVDELARLLTSGRLSREKRELMVSIYEQYSGDEAHIHLQQLIATSPEFHTTGLARGNGLLRVEPEKPGPSSKPYKAVIQISLRGGWDSHNVLVPAVCEGKNDAGDTVDAQYRSIRGNLALNLDETNLRVSVDASSGQPCSSFAIHQKVPIFKELYDEGSLAFFANAGLINTAETNKKNYQEVTVSTLFAHNTMAGESKKVDPFEEAAGTGVLGRMSKVLDGKGYSTAGLAIDGPTESLGGTVSPQLVVGSRGATEFNVRPSGENFPLEELAAEVNGMSEEYSSLFGETWSADYISGVADAKFLSANLGKATVGGKLEQTNEALAMIVRLLQTKDARGVDRDMLYYGHGFWDHHDTMKDMLSASLEEFNEELTLFVAELKNLGLWDNVAIILTSEFGRALTENGRSGSDHGWAGQYVVLGGAVRGGQILGQYPYDLTENGPLNIGKGARLMPTLSWESIWSGISEWMGVETDAEMKEVLPNIENTNGGIFFGPYTRADMFFPDGA